MPVTITNERLPRPRIPPRISLKAPGDVFHQWRQNGSVAMSACSERSTHFFRFLHLTYCVKRPITACRYTRAHFLATTEGSLPITALSCGFEISEPLVLDAKKVWLWTEAFTQIFSCFLDAMMLFAGIFSVFQGIFPKTYGLSLLRVFVDGCSLNANFQSAGTFLDV